MRTPFKFCGVAVLLATSISVSLAQRPRSVSNDSATETKISEDRAALPPPPVTTRAKYEGGVFGYNKKEDGTLSFDDVNGRLVFRNKLNKETISIPYSSVMAAYGDTKSLRPAAASVVSAIPLLYTLPAQFIRRKYQYLTLQFNDPDTNASGITSFKLENKEVLASELAGLAQKANLSPRGDGFVRRKDAAAPTTSASSSEAQDTISAGILNGKATALPRPDYPDAARQARAAGTVSVQVTIDEQGNVVNAEAVNGDPLLHDAATAAARKAKFAPTVLNGRPVKVIGVLNYDFVL